MKTFRKRSTWTCEEPTQNDGKDTGTPTGVEDTRADREERSVHADPELADFYVVPLLPECYVRDVEKGGADYVTAVRKVNKMYQVQSTWGRGTSVLEKERRRDHVFIFPTEKGAENVLNEKTLERIGKAIKIVGVPI